MNITGMDNKFAALPDNDIVRMQTRGILYHLEGLGGENAISRIFTIKHEYGIPCKGMMSPLGVHISNIIGSDVQVMVSPGWVCVYSAARHESEWRVPVSLREFPNVRRFLWGFDTGCYPGLIDMALMVG